MNRPLLAALAAAATTSFSPAGAHPGPQAQVG